MIRGGFKETARAWRSDVGPILGGIGRFISYLIPTFIPTNPENPLDLVVRQPE